MDGSGILRSESCTLYCAVVSRVVLIIQLAIFAIFVALSTNAKMALLPSTGYFAIFCNSEFDEPNGTFNAEFSLYLDWQMRDTLSYKWEPDIVFINSLQQVSKISEVEKFEVDKVHRRFRQIKRLKGTFVSTELAFQDFPCDYQVFPCVAV